MKEDLTDAFGNVIASSLQFPRERAILEQVIPVVLQYIDVCKAHLSSIEAVCRFDPPTHVQGEDEGMSSDMMRVMYGRNYSTHPASLFYRLNQLSTLKFERGDRVLKLTSVVGAIGSPRVGTKLLNAAKLLATRAGAWLIIEAITWPLLPFRFYFQQGFNFIAPRNLASGARVDKWHEGTVWMAWKPPGPIRSSAEKYEKHWTTRDFSMSKKEECQNDLVRPVGSYESFMTRLSSVAQARTIPVKLTRSSRYFNTICVLFDSSFNAYRRRNLPAFIATYRPSVVYNIQENHHVGTDQPMASVRDLSTSEIIADKALRSFGATTICAPEAQCGKRPREECESPLSRGSECTST
jgi:hypothetical protein